MLSTSITKRAGALALMGDYQDLNRLYYALHAVIFNGACGSAHKLEDYLFGLPYDVRKARDGAREKRKGIESFDGKTVEYRSVKIPLLRLLFLVLFYKRLVARHGKSQEYRKHAEDSMLFAKRMDKGLRAAGKGALADRLSPPRERPLSRFSESMIGLLEGLVADSITELGLGSGSAFLARVERSLGTWKEWPDYSVIESLDFDFLYRRTTKKSRLAMLAEIPTLLERNSAYVTSLMATLAESAKKHGCSVSELCMDWEGQPDPKY